MEPRPIIVGVIEETEKGTPVAVLEISPFTNCVNYKRLVVLNCLQTCEPEIVCLDVCLN